VRETPKIAGITLPVIGIEFSSDVVNPTIAIFYDVDTDSIVDPERLDVLEFWEWNGGTPQRITEIAAEVRGASGTGAWSPDDNTFATTSAGGFSSILTGVDNVRLLQGDGTNVVTNGSFEDVTGMTEIEGGYEQTGGCPGWTDAEAGRYTQIFTGSLTNIEPTDGIRWVSASGRSPSDVLAAERLDLSQDIAGLTPGETLTLSYDILPNPGTPWAIQIFWGGELVEFGDDGGTVAALTDQIFHENVVVPANSDRKAPLARMVLAANEGLAVEASAPGLVISASRVIKTESRE